MPRMDIKEWAKTPDGRAQLESHKPFVIGGEIWQGFEGNAVKAAESLVTSAEIESMPDIDATKTEVWFRRKQRLEGRLQRKMAEYDERRGKLREERSKIRNAIKEDKELGIPPSADDINQIGRINTRMERLVDLTQELDIEAARVGEQEGIAGAMLDEEGKAAPPPPTVCELCEKQSPPGANDPEKWLRAHTMGAHKNPRKKENVA